MRNNRLEAQILSSIDELVQCAISAGLKEGEAREEEIERGAAIIQEIGHLLVEALEGREEHLKSLVEQLAAQRLPDRRVLQSFGHFSRDLQEIIERGVSSYLKSKGSDAGESASLEYPSLNVSEQPDEGTLTGGAVEVPTSAQARLEQKKEQGESKSLVAKLKGLRLALEQAFPGEELLENFVTRGGKLDYFLPRLNLGFELNSAAPNWRKEFFLRQAGIRVIKVTEGELRNPLALARRLRRPGSLQAASNPC
ncbi:hypothetical protein SAMN00808754_2113 [Thermanaeromonas toyohensis ToBE]|uniref:Uncharacterized protein n=1 Tax=Thermanaeromonas toyohensis ToBE TaxID=698762 RepID=A0A1W1VXW4_9FIRM|nr:hypothetical protein [Thermanaeromonas toyohensis]SMB98083.1 hypothetical protein SAMN00808754_2113 [Thermanaeromonas toyohensis ToBE]